MAKINKQVAGFKFGKFRLEVIQKLGEVCHKGRTYRLVQVQTSDNQIYFSLRLYNSKGKFIKQLLFEPEIAIQIRHLLFQIPDFGGFKEGKEAKWLNLKFDLGE